MSVDSLVSGLVWEAVMLAGLALAGAALLGWLAGLWGR